MRTTTTTTITAEMATMLERDKAVTVLTVTAKDFHNGVTKLVHDMNFVESSKSMRVPLPMLAFAKMVVEEMIRPKSVNAHDYFEGITMTVPALKESIMSPEYHSIVGQKLLYVDWCTMHGMPAPCSHCGHGTLQNDRTNFSKNKLLFFIFVIDGPPMWAMVQSMLCS